MQESKYGWANVWLTGQCTATDDDDKDARSPLITFCLLFLSSFSPSCCLLFFIVIQFYSVFLSFSHSVVKVRAGENNRKTFTSPWNTKTFYIWVAVSLSFSLPLCTQYAHNMGKIINVGMKWRQRFWCCCCYFWRGRWWWCCCCCRFHKKLCTA